MRRAYRAAYTEFFSSRRGGDSTAEGEHSRFSLLSLRRTVVLIVVLTAWLPSVSGGESPRIVSLSPAVTELVFQLGQGRFMVGRSEVCNYPEETASIPPVGRYADPALERVVKLRPTMVLTNDLRSPRAGEVLRKLGVKVIVKQCRTVGEYREWVALLGRELGCPAEAEAELARFDREIAELRALKPLPVSLLWVISDSPLMTGGGRSLLSEVSQLAGMRNSGDVCDLAYFRLSRDFLLKNPPDVVVWANSGAVPDERANFWGGLAAVKKGRILHYLHEDTVMRPGPRLPAGIRKLRGEVERMMEASR